MNTQLIKWWSYEGDLYASIGGKNCPKIRRRKKLRQKLGTIGINKIH